jgi:hypothetical protein
MSRGCINRAACDHRPRLHSSIGFENYQIRPAPVQPWAAEIDSRNQCFQPSKSSNPTQPVGLAESRRVRRPRPSVGNR